MPLLSLAAGRVAHIAGGRGACGGHLPRCSSSCPGSGRCAEGGIRAGVSLMFRSDSACDIAPRVAGRVAAHVAPRVAAFVALRVASSVGELAKCRKSFVGGLSPDTACGCGECAPSGVRRALGAFFGGPLCGSVQHHVLRGVQHCARWRALRTAPRYVSRGAIRASRLGEVRALPPHMSHLVRYRERRDLLRHPSRIPPRSAPRRA